MKIKLKGYTNKTNGQTRFHWRKDIINATPKELEINIDKRMVKKGIFWGKIKW